MPRRVLRRTLQWLFLAALVASVSPAQRPKRAKKSAQKPLPVRVEQIIRQTPALARAHIGIRVLRPDGKVVYERLAGNWFVPASNTKLYSTALALSTLGPDYRMKTLVTAAAPADAQGKVHGDVRLVGGGDPTLSGRTYPYSKDAEWGDPMAALREMALRLAAAGVKRIDGDIVGDDTRYEWEPFPGGWGIDDPLFEYGAPVSALTLNDNSLHVTVAPGTADGEPAHVSVSPEVGQFLIVPAVSTVAVDGRGRLRLRRDPGDRELRVEGTIPVSAKPTTTLAAVEDPALFAARAFREALLAAGVEVRGEPRARHRIPGRDPGPDLPHVLAEKLSPPLSEIVGVVNKVSQNLHAELLLCEVSRRSREFGSRNAGLDDLRAFLENEVGLDKSDVNFEDGSGLSRLTLLTPTATTNLLLHMASATAREPVRAAWMPSLPVGGTDGTLDNRFQGFRDAGRVHAKTGTLSHVSALGGYLDHPRHGQLIFTILVNNYNTPASEARKGMDKIVVSLLD